MNTIDNSVRVRFAPSPTGEPHVGNIRSAIFNWLFARRWGGTFIVRVEDTDQNRKVEGSTELMLESLQWLGVDWDEGPEKGGDFGPYYQSERLQLYEEASDYLIANDSAYRCFCSADRLRDLRKEQERLKQDTGYDRKCRDLSVSERKSLEAESDSSVVRFKMPLDCTSEVDDVIRGKVSFDNSLIDDFVIMKSDGFPTYHLANVVDDHHMQISHVLRAEEWLPSVPRHIQLYEAFGWDHPKFAHMPIILAPDRSKLSKRHGATSVAEYREQGYLPDAMMNFLSMLGWSLDDHTEIMSVKDLCENFSIERVSKSGAIFNLEKLNWMNGVYIRDMSPEDIADELLSFWESFPVPEVPSLPSRELMVKIVPLIRERMKTLTDAAPLVPFFFNDEITFDEVPLIQKGMDSERTLSSLDSVLHGLEDLSQFDAETIESYLRSQAESLDVKVGQLLGTLRVATTGLKVSPPIFQTMEVLGRERTIESIRKAMATL